uniref:Sphingosine kinase 1 n=1 Tax=Hucho hucho TaxID=62062 RepID=A0A4W5MNB2_9TELE
MVLVNPQSGRGQALQLFSGQIEPMLTEASVPYTLVITVFLRIHLKLCLNVLGQVYGYKMNEFAPRFNGLVEAVVSDYDSEKYRLVGPMRFLVGTLMRLASLRVYQGRLAYLPAPPSTPQNSSLFNQKGPPDSLLADLEQPVPEHWTVVNEEDFVLVLAMFQSHLAEDLFAAPGATADDGFIHLLYVRAGISRLALLTLFMTMEKGGHLAIGCPHLVYERVKAFRLEPLSPEGAITVDGEMVEYGPVQAQVHEGIARLISANMLLGPPPS